MFNIDKDRFIIVAIILFLMWCGFMLFLYMKADEITKDPCSICAKRMGEKVRCTIQGFTPISRDYYPNFTIEDVRT